MTDLDHEAILKQLGTFVLSQTAKYPFMRPINFLMVQDQIPSLTPKYTGYLNSLSRMVRDQGFFSLYRGHLASVISSLQIQLYLVGWSAFDKAFPEKTLLMKCAAEVTKACWTAPMKAISDRMAMDVGTDEKTREFTGVGDCYTKLTRHEGFGGLFNGVLVSLAGLLVYKCSLKTLKDLISEHFPSLNSATTNSFGYEKLVKYGVHLISGLMAYPFEIIRRRLLLDLGKSWHEKQ